MTINRAQSVIKSLLNKANIEINGPRPWDIQLNNTRFYDAILQKKELGFGESYMAGWWDCQELDTCVMKLLKANVTSHFKIRPKFWLEILTHRLFNFQSKRRAYIVAKQHYDVGNDLFHHMLDDNMVYSCGYWKTATNLNQAQIDKLDLICQKLYLKPGMKLLDIGCGFASLAKYAAQHYGVEVVGITVSKEQAELAKIRCKGLPVDIQLCDYRDIRGQFDRIASIGMFEHVGYKNYSHFMHIVKKNLIPKGLFLLHTMGSNYTVFNNNEWLEKYIFPNGMLPSIKQLGAASENLFIMEDWHNFGTYYYPTLMSWHKNFNAHWDDLKSTYSEQFKRMWNFYLLSCAGSAKARGFQVWQVVLSNESDENYQARR